MSIHVNFHTHSTFSDGHLTPEALVARLARDDVLFAALTDHDTIGGLARFEQAARAEGIGVISGVELTVQPPRGAMGEMHILGYGFDPSHPELLATLDSLRQNQPEDVQSIANSVRKGHSPHSAAPQGVLPVAEAIALLHRAGGQAFLAHPLLFEPDFDLLAASLIELKKMRLDGIEAIYAGFGPAEQALLAGMADDLGLMISAGTDVHNPNSPDVTFGIEMPRRDWIVFRAAVSAPKPDSAAESPLLNSNPPPTSQPAFRRRYFILRILLPTILAIVLFLAVIWGLILPSFENSLLERKRELIRELTNTAWSILASYESKQRAGTLSLEQAQAQAKAQIESLRYGPDGKDYFWLQNSEPRILMHPYRRDLNGQDVSDFTDPNGVRLFVEFAKLVERQGEGYLDYVWQWQDDPARLEPKESYVRGFEPWGWIIGTGLYIDDVQAEIAQIEGRLVNASLLISAAVIVLLGFVVQQSLRIEHQRRQIEAGLRQSTERYQALVEAASEGTLLVLGGRCHYANPILLKMTGYSLAQLDLLEWQDLMPRVPVNAATWEQIDHGAGGSFEGSLQHADQHPIACLLAIHSIDFAGQDGWILLARELSTQTGFAPGIASGLAEMVEAAPVGMFRARTQNRGAFVHLNERARQLMAGPEVPLALADLFDDPHDFDLFLRHLQERGKIEEHSLHRAGPDGSTRFLALSAQFHTPPNGAGTENGATIDGTLQDVTAARKQEAERAELIDRLQTSLLFLHEPIGRLGRDALTCSMETAIAELARQMTRRNTTAALVIDPLNHPIGIVTDHDLRARVLAENADLTRPVTMIMSAPIGRISERALIYEALMRMEEQGVQHLAVEDENGQIVSLIDHKSLIQFQRYGAIVLSRQIGRASSPAEVARNVQQAPPLIIALVDSGARPRQVTHVLAGVCDAASQRLIEQAIEQLGPPPAAFTWLAMGSQGRQEQTLLTDQDNGIIFATPAKADAEAVNAYFLELGERVNAGLAEAGYALCRGGVMAGQPRWCRSLADWKHGFEGWVRKAEPQELIDFSIFFDFRPIYGEVELAHELRSDIHRQLEGVPGFFPFFARNALTFKPPMRLLGSIYLGGEHAGQINLKDAAMPIVSFARLYALRHQINQTHTLERIESLAERGILQAASRDEIITAYDFLMRLRLQNQVKALTEGHPPDNVIQASKLGYIEQELLKQAFAQIAAVQKKVGYEFFGGISG